MTRTGAILPLLPAQGHTPVTNQKLWSRAVSHLQPGTLGVTDGGKSAVSKSWEGAFGEAEEYSAY